MTLPFRIGFGYDSHRTDPSRTLKLGGVTFENVPGLAGHSDADVLLHAITDAILSAAGEGDIGSRFPDTDPAFKDADSLELLSKSLLTEWTVAQIDATVVCDQPKIGPRREEIIKTIKSVLNEDAIVSVKGKTSEGLGALGRGEGIVAFAVVILARKDSSL